MGAQWFARRQAYWASLAVRDEGTQRSAKHELLASKLGLFNIMIGHVGDGNFHQIMMYNPDIPEQKHAVTSCLNRMVEDAIAMGGTVSVRTVTQIHRMRFRTPMQIQGVHGIDLQKKHCLTQELDRPTLGVVKALKDTLDPHWFLNPGKVFDDE
ncbi:hypothetical protein E4U61_003196 [Claviceps capensis]|nr:hypothetical protein E4U61_003196 [Claviceps capensis]